MATVAQQRTDQDLLELLALPETLAGQPAEAELELTPEERQFADERRTILGGSDAPAILGLSTYRNAWDVAAEKKGIVPPFAGTERTLLGSLFEDPIRREYARRTGQVVEKPTAVLRDAALPFLGGHPDGLVVPAERRKGVEVKTVEFGREKWSRPGEPLRVPRDYYVQCQHYLSITGYETWDLVALFGLSTIRWYTLERNERVIAAMRERLAEFHERYVVGPDMPPMEPSERAQEYLRLRYPAPANDTIVVANEQQAEAIAKWREAKGAREEWERHEEKWKLHVQTAIGDAKGIVAGGVTVTWTKNRDTVALVTDWERVVRSLCERHDLAIPADLITDNTRELVQRKGARQMRVKE